MGRGEWGVGGAGGDEGDKGIRRISNAQCPMPNAQCPMPNAQSRTIRAILSLPAKIVAIVTELIWRSES
ncbi:MULTISPECIES: hypothetical protein [unclassified Nostoc]|uniref:hypothetical protein n=1 Tax=unclassified Nostoc TaxID=2593658 RepID=UPI00261D2A87|nr:hypothetical protein [Nostoc sp. S13]MDF5734289.1 hypothetical protein [Nostoc sp. S13]